MKKNNYRPRTLCIATLDPWNKGGILSMMKFVYNQANKNNFRPFLTYNIVASLRGFKEKHTLLDFIFMRHLKIEMHKENFDSMFGIGIERVLPEFEFFNYILNLKQWAKSISKANYFLAIGGSNHCAIPFWLLKKNFSLWVASTFLEDRKDRIKREGFLRKIRDWISWPVLIYFEKKVFKEASKILALSKYTKKKIVERYNIPESKIKVVHFPIDVKKFQPIKFRYKKNNYLLFVGRINDKRKNIPLLIKSFYMVRQKHSEMRLKLIGEKPKRELKELTRNLGIEKSVDFIDEVPNSKLPHYYQNAAAFVLPSFQEGLCIAALEAMACGTPVISTRCGGPEDFIKNGINGYLVENNNEQELSTAIVKYLNLNPKKKKCLSRNSRDYILKHHKIDKIWPIFSSVLN